ncbi:cilia- and flagella-associated protein 251-like [Pimephales promelas]|uniref:cilia- and flagella-associated protein 251-like n=1 Tax=Pimephales promelas TaxID=90988 RepID=UPI001955EA88|nr:cilia- and flagella-associated protein 251-like [Pimephales promelas]
MQKSKFLLPRGLEVHGPSRVPHLRRRFRHAFRRSSAGGGIGFYSSLSLSSQIKFTHSNDDRVKLSKFMCHDTRTADKFYMANLTPQQAMEHRRLFDTALEGEERCSPSKQPTSIKRKRPAKGKEPLKKKRRAPESSDEEMTSGSTTPEATKSPEYQEPGTSRPDSSGHEEQQDEEEEEAESGAAAVGSQEEEEKAESGAAAVGSQEEEKAESGAAAVESREEEEKAESGAAAVGSQEEKAESGAAAVGSQEEEEKAESGAEAVGSQEEEEEETTTPKKYPRRRGKATVLLTPLKCLPSTQRHVSPLKVKKAIFSPTSTTLVGLTRQKEVSKKVKEAIKKRRQRK